MRRTVSVSLFVLLFVVGPTSAFKREKSKKEPLPGETDNDQDNMVLLSDDSEVPTAESDELRKAKDDFLNKVEIDDLVEHKPPVVEADAFDEFIVEKNSAGSLDPKAEALYKNAVKVLLRRRYADVTPSDLRNAYMDLEEAVQLDHADAEKTIAFAYLFGDYRWSIEEARQIFERLAQRGSPDAHLGLGFLYSAGLGVGGPNAARALLHYTFAALGGNPLAQMALGYRYGYGVSTTQSCESSLLWYKKVAERVASKVKLTGSTSIQRVRLPDEAESTSTIGTILDNNVFSYYKYLADDGDMQAILGLAQLYLTGSKGVPLNLEMAAKYFKIAADAGNTQAFGYLGKMYLEGTPATPQSNATALQYYKKAADKNNAVGQCGLGIMYLYGYGVKADTGKAIKFFSMAAEQGSADAQLHLGEIYFKGLGVGRDFKLALKYFQLASQSGHILALYNLAQMHAKGLGVFRNCKFAMILYKNVAERGRWSERFMDAYVKFQNGHTDEAAFRYLFLAELGYEVAQTNFAHLMDQNESQLFAKKEAYKRAMLSWQRSANQDYAVARVKLGDYNYYGLGTIVDYGEAASHYQVAANVHQNAQAMFNLGFMHEHGLGVSKDLYLAKRYYDRAAETSADAFVPVALALIKLRFEFIYDYLLSFKFQHFTFTTPRISILDTTLGPDWDLYAMSLLAVIVIWLVFSFRNRN